MTGRITKDNNQTNRAYWMYNPASLSADLFVTLTAFTLVYNITLSMSVTRLFIYPNNFISFTLPKTCSSTELSTQDINSEMLRFSRLNYEVKEIHQLGAFLQYQGQQSRAVPYCFSLLFFLGFRVAIEPDTSKTCYLFH